MIQYTALHPRMIPRRAHLCPAFLITKIIEATKNQAICDIYGIVQL